MPRRIVRTILGAAAAGAVIAAFGLTAGTAHAATGRVQVIPKMLPGSNYIIDKADTEQGSYPETKGILITG
jgi:hypothetical protein